MIIWSLYSPLFSYISSDPNWGSYEIGCGCPLLTVFSQTFSIAYFEAWHYVSGQWLPKFGRAWKFDEKSHSPEVAATWPKLNFLHEVSWPWGLKTAKYRF